MLTFKSSDKPLYLCNCSVYQRHGSQRPDGDE